MERAERIRQMRQAREPSDERDTDDDSSVEPPRSPSDAEQAAGEDSPAETTIEQVPSTTADADSEGSTATTDPTSVDGGSVASSTAEAGSEATASAENAPQASAEPSVGQAASAAQPSPSGGIAPLGGSAVSIPGESPDESSGDGSETDADRPARQRGTDTAATEESVRVLEFTIGDQVYCIDIERVEEIVKRNTVTRVPNTASYVEGVVDLRGQITTILDTKQLLDVDDAGRQSLLVIFAPEAFEEHGTVGWVVDEVRQVVPVMDSQVRMPPSDDPHVRGIVGREEDDELIVWVRPGRAMSEAVGDVESD